MYLPPWWNILWQDFGRDNFAENDNDIDNDIDGCSGKGGDVLGSSAASVGRAKHGKEAATGGDGKAELM